MGGSLTTALVAIIALFGCTVGPDYQPPKIPPTGDSLYVIDEPPERTPYVGADGGETQVFLYGERLPSDWWRLFKSAKLNGLIENAFAGNFNLDAARARLNQAYANLRATRGRLFPEVELRGDLSRQRSGSSGFNGASEFDSDSGGSSSRRSSSGSGAFSVYTGNAVVSYGIDLFGRARRGIEAQSARTERQLYELDAARLALAGNIVTTVLRAAELRARIDARQELIQAQEERLRIIEMQLREGALARAALVSARADWASARAPLPRLAQDLVEAQHQLALLVGTSPSLWMPVQIELSDLELPAELPVSLPSELVRRRPDIAAAESFVRATSAEIGIAQANLYPDITLDGSFGLVGFSGSGGGAAFGPSWSIASSILTPLFNAGRLRGERDAAIAAHHAALAEYRQTVLNAFVEVADALRALEHGAEAVDARFAALSAARASLDVAEFRFREGVSDYLEVLVARQQHQQAALDYVSALATRFQNTARLFTALGGVPGASQRLQSSP